MPTSGCLWVKCTFSLLFCLEVSASDELSIHFNVFSFYFYNMAIFVFNLVFSSFTSFIICFSCSVYEYNLYLSWYIFLGKIREKSCEVRSGFKILTSLFRAWLLLISSQLDCPQYPCFGFADCGLYTPIVYLIDYFLFNIKYNNRE